MSNEETAKALILWASKPWDKYELGRALVSGNRARRAKVSGENNAIKDESLSPDRKESSLHPVPLSSKQ